MAPLLHRAAIMISRSSYLESTDSGTIEMLLLTNTQTPPPLPTMRSFRNKVNWWRGSSIPSVMYDVSHVSVIKTQSHLISYKTWCSSSSLLWSPYVIGQTIIFSSCFMVALCNRKTIYIFMLWFVLSSFFYRLISAIGDWMFTILWHMVWPQCEFRMQVWNAVHAARCKYRMQKSRQKSPSGHHRTTLSGYIFATKPRIDNRKKLVKQQYLLHMSS